MVVLLGMQQLLVDVVQTQEPQMPVVCAMALTQYVTEELIIIMGEVKCEEVENQPKGVEVEKWPVVQCVKAEDQHQEVEVEKWPVVQCVVAEDQHQEVEVEKCQAVELQEVVLQV